MEFMIKINTSTLRVYNLFHYNLKFLLAKILILKKLKLHGFHENRNLTFPMTKMIFNLQYFSFLKNYLVSIVTKTNFMKILFGHHGNG